MPRLVLVSELPGAAGGPPTAAALAVARAIGDDQPVALIEVGGRRRGPTMLASSSARSLEERLRAAGRDCRARGRLVSVPVVVAEGWEEELVATLALLDQTESAVVSLPPALLRQVLARSELGVEGVLLCAELPRQRALAALAVAELRAMGVAVKVAQRAPGRVGARRALAGIDPGGDASPRAARLAAALLRSPRRRPRDGLREPALAAETGQALPLVLGGVLALIGTTLVLAAFGGAVTGKSRTQRAADLAALSAARSMRDDFDRLFVPARRPDGSPNPAHLAKAAYLARARDGGRGGGAAQPRRPRPARDRVPRPCLVRAAAGPGRGRGRARDARRPAAGPGHRPGGGRGGAAGDAQVRPGSGHRQRRRLLRSARVPPGRGDAARRRRRLRPDGRSGPRRRCFAADQRRVSLRRRAGRALGRRIPTRAGSHPREPRCTDARPSSTSARPPPTLGWPRTRPASASSSATPGRPGTTASTSARRHARPPVTSSRPAARRRRPRGRRTGAEPRSACPRSCPRAFAPRSLARRSAGTSPGRCSRRS